MRQVRATAVVAAFGLFGAAARADDADWKPASTPPPATTTPAPTPVVPPPAGPASESPGWVPAKAPMVEPKTTPPTGLVSAPASPSSAEQPVVFRPASTPTAELQPTGLTETRSLVPNTLPPIAPIPVTPTNAGTNQPAVPVLSGAQDKPAERPKGESLPAPRPAAPPAPAPRPSPTAPAPGDTTNCPPLEPAPGWVPHSSNAVPVRHRVFGSPPINLSRDYAFRDLLGVDLLTEKHPRQGRLRDRFGTDEAFGETGEAYFVQTELLLWWAARGNTPVLATTSASGTGFGFLGNPDTRTLLGPGQFGPSFLPGFRVRAGGWLDECNLHGLDGSFFFIGPRTERRVFDGLPVLTRPIFAPNFNQEFGEVVARPGVSSGRLEVEQETFLWGADVNYRCAVCTGCDGGRGWFLGYRHLNLRDQLNITEFITSTDPASGDPVGTQIVVGDRFQTRNRFNGGQIGHWWTRKAGRLDLDVRASVALGVTTSTIDISGFQNRTRPGEATQSFTGGLLAAGPNLGSFSRNSFSVVPEVTANAGFLISPNVRVYAGYNFLYWSNVMRPGDQIDRVVDVTFVPNPPPGVPPSGQNRPTVPFTRSNFWAQGVQLGLEFRW